MRAGPRTPAELGTLLEVALLLGDYEALVGLFEKRSELATSREPPARGPEAIGRLALRRWHDAEPYFVASRHVLGVGDNTLMVTECGANLAHRCSDVNWRYTIFIEVGENRPKGARA